MVSLVTIEMLPRLRELWQAAFGDDSEYVDFVFTQLLRPEKMLVLSENNNPVAMLCMEPMELALREKTVAAVYMYAFCVDPTLQNHGYGGMLLEGFHRYLKKRKIAASVLTPASESLFTYYGKRGYQNAFAVCEQILTPEQFAGDGCCLVPRALDQLAAVRERYFANTGFVRWKPEYLHFTQMENSLRGGEVLVANCGTEMGYLVYRVEQGQAQIIEFAVPPKFQYPVLNSLHKRIGASEYKLRLRADYPVQFGGRVLPFAMIQWYDKQDGKESASYITFVMD